MSNPTTSEQANTPQASEHGAGDLDPSEASLIERTLLLTPEQRIDQLVATVAFIQAARGEIAKQRA